MELLPVFILKICTLALILLQISLPVFLAKGSDWKNFDYCKITCNNQKHTMCEYEEGGPPGCQEFTRDMKKSMREVLLDIHNSLRQQVAMGKGEGGQPPAGNMMELQWSDEGEKIAQRWADQCTQGQSPDACRSLSDGEAGGQSMIDTNTNNEVDNYLFLKNTVIDWFKTGANFKQELVAKYKSDPETAKYSQIVWAETTKLGCGYSYGIAQGNTSTTWRLICNYYPAGNIEGKPVYEDGKPCSKCPNVKCSTKVPGLCARPGMSVYNMNGTSGAVPGTPGGPSYTAATVYTTAALVLSLGYV